jgi:hypothetical protein
MTLVGTSSTAVHSPSLAVSLSPVSEDLTLENDGEGSTPCSRVRQLW